MAFFDLGSSLNWLKFVYNPLVDKKSISLDETQYQTYCVTVDSGESVLLRLLLQDKWQTKTSEVLVDVDDLSFLFHRPKHDILEDTWATISVNRSIGENNEEEEELLCQSLHLSDTQDGRLRFGSYLSVFLKSGRVTQFSRVIDSNSIYSSSDYSLIVYLIVQIKDCRYRWICEEGRVLGDQQILIDDGIDTVLKEVLSLHSPFFFSLFYGDHKERNDSVIRIEEVKKETLRNLIKCCVFGHYYVFFSIEKLSNLLHLCHRYGCNYLIPLHLINEIVLKNCYCKSDFKYILKIVNHCHKLDNQLFVRFLDRFVVHQLLISFYDDNKADFTPFTSSLHMNRMISLFSVVSARTKVVFVFDRGNITVEFLNELYPNTVRNIIDMFSTHKHVFRRARVSYHIGHDNLILGWNDLEIVKAEKRSEFPLFPVDQVTVAVYKSILRISRSCTDPIGYVVSGYDVLGGNAVRTLIDVLVLK